MSDDTGTLSGETDSTLVEMAQRAPDDTRPFEELLRRHQGFVVANCRYITRSAADAEDLGQEVFVKAFFAMRRFEARAQFRTWLGRIKVNHCLNHLRRTHGAVMVDVEGAGIANDPALRVAPRVDAEIGGDLIASTLDALSDTLRIPLLLRDADGLSYDEIAAQLRISLPAVKMRIKRGREEFRRMFAAANAPVGTHGNARELRV